MITGLSSSLHSSPSDLLCLQTFESIWNDLFQHAFALCQRLPDSPPILLFSGAKILLPSPRSSFLVLVTLMMSPPSIARILLHGYLLSLLLPSVFPDTFIPSPLFMTVLELPSPPNNPPSHSCYPSRLFPHLHIDLIEREVYTCCKYLPPLTLSLTSCNLVSTLIPGPSVTFYLLCLKAFTHLILSVASYTVNNHCHLYNDWQAWSPSNSMLTSLCALLIQRTHWWQINLPKA